jgi:hypothetical protein
VKHKSVLLILAGIVLGAGTGWILLPLALYKTEPQPFQFSHRVHAGDQGGMTCDNCHEFSPDGRFNGIPALDKCAGCHGTRMGATSDEQRLVEEYVTPGRPIPWQVYSRQPDNAHFPHAQHVKLAGLTCEECHGPRGTSDSMEVYQVNRISGYSRDIWGRNISGIPSRPWEGMKMDRCVGCHEKHGRADGCIDCHK